MTDFTPRTPMEYVQSQIDVALADHLRAEWMRGGGAADDEPDVFPVHCGFIAGSLHTNGVGADEDGRRVFWKTVEQQATKRDLDGDQAAGRCVILHQESSRSDTLDSQAAPTSIFIEVEVRLGDCIEAYRAMDVALSRLEAKGVLVQVISRYDEPPSDHSLEVGYGAHSAVIEVPGVCPSENPYG